MTLATQDDIDVQDLARAVAMFGRHPQEYSADESPVVSGEDDWWRERGAYEDWTEIMEVAMRPQFDMLEDFLPDAKLDERQQILVNRMCELGKFQLNAWCNNRLALLAGMRAQAEVIQQYLRDRQMPTSSEFEAALGYKPLPSQQSILVEMSHALFIMDGDESYLNKMLKEIRDEYVIIREGIRRDKDRNCFKDYTQLRLLLAVHQREGRDISSITMEMPYFLSEAVSFCLVTQQDTRRRNNQAVLSGRLDISDMPAHVLRAVFRGLDVGGDGRGRGRRRRRDDF